LTDFLLIAIEIEFDFPLILAGIGNGGINGKLK
jgi:hypothetical protein